ncbi:TIGR03619 family F420-dependent LLM class oxidoreductase [Spirillospora sp. NPDC048819]|uniref:TIGR03619 family F420-dependent LLM class oxidoreductase n=1 Tax=Spirillospora sp. NPDC048819 TaxID=3155268 RepID=UPI0033ED2F04
MSVNTAAPQTFRRGPRDLAIKITGMVPGLARNHCELLDLAPLLEEWGADHVILGQHLLRTGNPHPGGVTIDPRRPALDPFVILSFLAARTTRLGLATGAVIAPLHHPIGLAKAAATLDLLSSGRFQLGLVAGWDGAEFAAACVPFEERFARLDETIDVCHTLWRDAPASFSGRWTRLDEAYSLPRPASVPILVGGRGTAATARRVARRADGWIASEAARSGDVRQTVGLLREAMAAEGRAFEQLIVRATLPTPTASLRSPHQAADELLDAGATSLVLPLGAWTRDLAEAERLVRTLADRCAQSP